MKNVLSQEEIEIAEKLTCFMMESLKQLQRILTNSNKVCECRPLVESIIGIENNINSLLVLCKADKSLKLLFNEEKGWEENCEILTNKEEHINFVARDLSSTPEDAIIWRGIFDADDYIKSLNKGMELAKKGYSSIEVIEEEREEEEE